jgi:hypothetical protein
MSDARKRLARTPQRVAFKTSRLAEFCGEKELTAQTGHAPEDWPLVIAKELPDNALDACEEAEIGTTSCAPPPIRAANRPRTSHRLSPEALFRGA